MRWRRPFVWADKPRRWRDVTWRGCSYLGMYKDRSRWACTKAWRYGCERWRRTWCRWFGPIRKRSGCFHNRFCWCCCPQRSSDIPPCGRPIVWWWFANIRIIPHQSLFVFSFLTKTGPFSVLLTFQYSHVTVHAKDLNPRSYRYLKQNAQPNKCDGNRLFTYDMDGRSFFRFMSNRCHGHTEAENGTTSQKQTLPYH